jgi:hypothetical protein
MINKPCEYCGESLPLGTSTPARRIRSRHFETCRVRMGKLIERELEMKREEVERQRLLDAAPDLLAALRRALDAGIGADWQEPSPAEQARAAIAKAEGQS